MVSGLIWAALGFHRIKGYGKLNELIKALELKNDSQEELQEVALRIELMRWLTALIHTKSNIDLRSPLSFNKWPPPCFRCFRSLVWLGFYGHVYCYVLIK